MSTFWWLKSAADVGIIVMLVAVYRARIKHSRVDQRKLDELSATVKTASRKPGDRIM